MFTHPFIPDKYYSSWAQYSIVIPENIKRASVMAKFKEKGIPSMVYYKIPVHLQRGYSKYENKLGDFPISENISSRILSIPMHPYLNESDQDKVLNVIEYFN